ncbi:MAG: hypothetical protein HY348_15990 [Nitrospira defluvii]|nr:hypothetical protein [Nitrospira defluvii]
MKHVARRTGSVVAASVGAVVIAILFAVMAAPADAATIYPYWIDDIKGAIAFYKGDAYYKKEYPNARWDLYIDQMQEVDLAYRKGDVQTDLWGDESVHGHAGGAPRGDPCATSKRVVQPLQFRDAAGVPRRDTPRSRSKNMRDILL